MDTKVNVVRNHKFTSPFASICGRPFDFIFVCITLPLRMCFVSRTVGLMFPQMFSAIYLVLVL